MAFSMIPDSDDEKVKRYLEQEKMGGGPRPMGQAPNAPRGGSSSLGLPPNPYGVSPFTAPGPRAMANGGLNPQPPAYGDMGNPRSAMPPPGPGGMLPPAAQQRPPGAGGPVQATGQALSLPGGPGPMGAMNPRMPDSVTGAGAATAAAGGGMGAMAPIIAVLGQYLSAQQQRNAMRKQGREELMAGRARQLGYPTAGLEAARINRDARGVRGDDLLSMLAPFASNKRFTGQG